MRRQVSKRPGMTDRNDVTGSDSPYGRRENTPNPEVNQSIEHPYGDAGNLYEIPRVRSDDPPMRRWWMDDEPQDGGGSQQNG
jgi:hypothetical protein